MILWLRKVYLDHNATTPLAPEVRKTMHRTMKANWGNPSSLHTAGRQARGIIDSARQQIAAMLNCRPEQITFTSGGTEGNNMVIKGVFGKTGQGHIVTSKIEHESILGACSQVEQIGGMVTYVSAGTDGRVKAEDIKQALRPDTVLVSIMHANNETGAIQPIEEIAALCAANNVPFHTDAVQSFGKISTDVKQLNCDYLTLNAHKINGPKGIGAIYQRKPKSLRPLIFGGDQELGQRAGTESIHQIAGMAEAVRLKRNTMDEEFKRLKYLRNEFLSCLKNDITEIIINEAAEQWQMPGSVNITFPGHQGITLLAGLDCYCIGVSIGSACTADRIAPSHVLLGMGLNEETALSTIRISMGSPTSLADMLYTVKVLKKIVSEKMTGFEYLDPQHLTMERILSPGVFLIDLRFPYERMLAPSIPSAEEWSHIFFDRYIRKIPRNKEVIMMCGTGIFSSMAGYRLARAGHHDVKVVYGGYAAWRALYPDMLEKIALQRLNQKNKVSSQSKEISD